MARRRRDHPAWARFLAATLDANSRSGEPKNLAKVFPKAVHEKLMKHVGALLQAEPTLFFPAPAARREVVVVGTRTASCTTR